MNDPRPPASRLLPQAAKCPPSLMVVLILSASPSWAEDPSPIPTAWPSARYEKLKQQSPFALATPVEPAADPQTSFAANWFVSGIGHLDGEDFVTIKARDLSAEFSLYGHDTNTEHGVTLASIEWSEKIGKSTVVITKGTETAKLEFNEAEIRGPAKVTTATGTPAGGPNKGTPPMLAGIRPTATFPAKAMPSGPVAERPTNPGAMPKPTPYLPSAQTPVINSPLQGQDRRRIRTINAPQQR